MDVFHTIRGRSRRTVDPLALGRSGRAKGGPCRAHDSFDVGGSASAEFHRVLQPGTAADFSAWRDPLDHMLAVTRTHRERDGIAADVAAIQAQHYPNTPWVSGAMRTMKTWYLTGTSPQRQQIVTGFQHALKRRDFLFSFLRIFYEHRDYPARAFSIFAKALDGFANANEHLSDLDFFGYERIAWSNPETYWGGVQYELHAARLFAARGMLVTALDRHGVQERSISRCDLLLHGQDLCEVKRLQPSRAETRYYESVIGKALGQLLVTREAYGVEGPLGPRALYLALYHQYTAEQLRVLGRWLGRTILDSYADLRILLIYARHDQQRVLTFDDPQELRWDARKPHFAPF